MVRGFFVQGIWRYVASNDDRINDNTYTYRVESKKALRNVYFRRRGWNTPYRFSSKATTQSGRVMTLLVNGPEFFGDQSYPQVRPCKRLPAPKLHPNRAPIHESRVYIETAP